MPLKRLRWRTARRDSGLLKRAHKLSATQKTVFQTTATAQDSLLAHRTQLKRHTRNSAAAHESACRSSRVYLASAALRAAARKFVYLKGRAALNPSKVQRARSRANTRLDTQVQRTTAPDTRARGVSSLPVTRGRANLVCKPLCHQSLQSEVSTSTPFVRELSYHKWELARSAYKLAAQQRLRNGALVTAHADGASISSNRTAPIRAILQTRGKYLSLGPSRIYGPRRLREYLLVSRAAEALPNRLAFPTEASMTTGQPSKAFLTRPQDVIPHHAEAARRHGFLTQIFNRKVAQKYTASSLRDEASLSRQQRRYRELQFYRRRLKLRLPNTAITRQRRRKSGLVAFVRNSLKRPKTRAGQQRLLLPPALSLSAASKLPGTGRMISDNTLAAYERHDDAHPIF